MDRNYWGTVLVVAVGILLCVMAQAVSVRRGRRRRQEMADRLRAERHNEAERLRQQQSSPLFGNATGFARTSGSHGAR